MAHLAMGGDLELYNCIQLIVEHMYDTIFPNVHTHHLVVHESIAKWAMDSVLTNLEQYKLILHVDNEDGLHRM